MTAGTFWILPLAVAATAWLLTGAVRRYALRGGLIDVPAERSSHIIPTPRGGGAAIVVAMLLAWVWMAARGGDGLLPPAAMLGALIVAAVGFVDDHGHVPPLLRLAGHFAAAVLAVTSVGGLPAVLVFGRLIDPGWAGDAAAVVFVVWMINLTNFMDGIDGILSVQAITVCVAGAALCLLAAPASGLWREPLLVAAATTGFLVWNWPPARIFMGDVGSGYLGYSIAVFSIRAVSDAPALGWAWLILSAVFIADTTITLLRRAARRENVFAAHRTHAYQQLAAAWRSHREVTLLVTVINTLYLAPLAFAVTMSWLDGAVAALAAYVPLIAAIFRYSRRTT